MVGVKISTYNLQFDKFCAQLGLGKLSTAPETVAGGHLHRMYAVQTEKGKFAVKALNPQVMLRPKAKQNIIDSEHITRLAAKYVPAAPALVFDASPLQETDGQYYLVYDWIDGKTLSYGDLAAEHCACMGAMLAKIHLTDFSNLGLTDDYTAQEPIVD